MLEIAQADLVPALEVVRTVPTQLSTNGIRFGSYGDTQLSELDIEQLVQTVPDSIAAALRKRAYYFVPLTLTDASDTKPGENSLADLDAARVMVAAKFTTELSDAAVCHRNSTLDGVECLFVSTRLMQDRFALSFELYINIGHQFVDAAGVPESFMNLLWSQVESGVRGETSQDAWENRAAATGRTDNETSGQQSARSLASTSPRKRRIKLMDAVGAQPGSLPGSPFPPSLIDEKARSEYFHAAFADAIAIYLLSLTVDFDYTELREREYPLLAANALAERLRHVAELFPPNTGQEFSIRYRRRNS